jgi:CPA2 family monovalent cation:H+ antiporter-2
MAHDPILVATFAAGLGFAFVLGVFAVRLGLPPLVGYLIAGVVLGPFTPGYVADGGLAGQFAELGVILLMFGVGLHFSLRDLAAARRVVVPGALLQIVCTGTLGAVIALLWGLGAGGAAVLGLSLCVASTVVLLKGLESRDLVDSVDGRLAVGWLVVEDVTMVVALVLLPALAPLLRGGASEQSVPQLALQVGLALAKVIGFVVLMVVVGRRFIPWLLEHVARLGSRELFTLAVVTCALGIGLLAAELFGVSFALGAFFAGAVISDSELSVRAAADALPMQDAFAVLFFVSVGMLFDPAVLFANPLRVVTLVAIIVIWKSVLSFALLRLLGQGQRTATLIGTALGQIGEFSFIVAALGVSLGLINRQTQSTIVAAAIIAITLNGPLLNAAARRLAPNRKEDNYDCSAMFGHVVLVGYGRVGHTVADALVRSAVPHVVVEQQEKIVAGLRRRGLHAIQGDATRAEVLARAGIASARLIVVTAPEPIRARRIVELALAAHPHISLAVRTHTAAEQEYYESLLQTHAARGHAVYAEREAALSLAHHTLTLIGRSDDEADEVLSTLRSQPTRPTEMLTAFATREFQSLVKDS